MASRASAPHSMALGMLRTAMAAATATPRPALIRLQLISCRRGVRSARRFLCRTARGFCGGRRSVAAGVVGGGDKGGKRRAGRSPARRRGMKCRWRISPPCAQARSRAPAFGPDCAAAAGQGTVASDPDCVSGLGSVASGPLHSPPSYRDVDKLRVPSPHPETLGSRGNRCERAPHLTGVEVEMRARLELDVRRQNRRDDAAEAERPTIPGAAVGTERQLNTNAFRTTNSSHLHHRPLSFHRRDVSRRPEPRAKQRACHRSGVRGAPLRVSFAAGSKGERHLLQRSSYKSGVRALEARSNP